MLLFQICNFLSTLVIITYYQSIRGMSSIFCTTISSSIIIMFIDNPSRLIIIPSIPGNYPSPSLCTITPHNTFPKTGNRNTLNYNMYNYRSRYGNNTSHLYGDNNHNIHSHHPNNLKTSAEP